MTRLADRIDEARHQLTRLPARLAAAHSLAYERPGISYDRGGSRNSDMPLPIRLNSLGQPHRHATSHDPAWATRHTQALQHLAAADRHASRCCQMLDWHVTPTNSTDVTRLCTHIDACLTLISHRGLDQLTPPARRELSRALTEIASAAKRVPNMQPPKPKPCRNPRERRDCRHTVAHRTTGLCTSCHQHEKDRNRKPSDPRRARGTRH